MSQRNVAMKIEQFQRAREGKSPIVNKHTFRWTPWQSYNTRFQSTNYAVTNGLEVKKLHYLVGLLFLVKANCCNH